MAQLKDGSTPIEDRLDRLPQFDEQSRAYGIRTVPVAGETLIEKRPRSYTHGVNYWLDQGREGRCVEFAICHDLLARPVQVDPRFTTDIIAGRKIYWPAQRDDQWGGGSYPGAAPHYEGTSVLQGVKTAATLGFYGEYRWAFTLEEAVLTLGYFGPLIIGINWFPGMFNTDPEGFIHPIGQVAGGHAILVHAIKIVWSNPLGDRAWHNVDLAKSYVTLHNSWGQDWGVNGRAKLSLIDFDALRQADGEICIPTVRKKSVLFPVKDLMTA